MNNTTSLSISQLRQKATQAIADVTDNQQPIVIYKRSKPKAILVDYQYYSALEQAIMDLTDAAEAEKAKKEKKYPFADYIKKRQQKS